MADLSKHTSSSDDMSFNLKETFAALKAMLIFDNVEKIKFRQTFQLSNKIKALVLTAEGRAIVDINMKVSMDLVSRLHLSLRINNQNGSSYFYSQIGGFGENGVVAEFHKEDSPKKTNWRRIPNKNKLPYVDQDVAILLPQYKENDALNSPESLSSVDILNAPTGKERKHVPPPGQDTDNSLNMSNQTLEEDDYVSFKPILNLAAHAAKSVEKYPTLSLVPLLAVLLSQLVRVLLHQKWRTLIRAADKGNRKWGDMLSSPGSEGSYGAKTDNPKGIVNNKVPRPTAKAIQKDVEMARLKEENKALRERLAALPQDKSPGHKTIEEDLILFCRGKTPNLVQRNVALVKLVNEWIRKAVADSHPKAPVPLAIRAELMKSANNNFAFGVHVAFQTKEEASFIKEVANTCREAKVLSQPLAEDYFQR
eukprot:g17324.t1